nr:hypothetical protein [Tanacetum cinerariifolium]GFA88689.1 hypothetical protein [Tanacetum cinerariifolium]
ERRDVPRGMGARAHGEVGLGALALFRCACVYRRRLGKGDEFWREGCGLLVLVLSIPVEDKPFESEFTSFLVMREGCETIIGFVLALALTVLGTCFSSLEVLK